MNTGLLLQIRNLTKSYTISRSEKIEAVKDLSLTLRQGEIYGFLGPNGAGKTTTLKIIVDLIRADSGTVNIFGNRTTNHRARSAVGYVPEETGFYGHLTGRAMLSVCAQLLGITYRERYKELDRVIVRPFRLNGSRRKRSIPIQKTFVSGFRLRRRFSKTRDCCFLTNRHPALTRWELSVCGISCLI